MPTIPAGIDENTSEFDERVRKYGDELIDHLIYLGITNRVERFVSEISKLPNVSSAQVLSDREVAVWWKNGTQGVPCMIYPERHDHRLRENSMQAFGGFFGAHKPTNAKIEVIPANELPSSTGGGAIFSGDIPLTDH